jgi:hypothetical protein
MSAVAGLLSSSFQSTSATADAGLDSKQDLVGEYQRTILVRNAKGMNVGTTLFGLMSRLKSEPSENSEYNWFERNPTRRELYVHTTNSYAPIPKQVTASQQDCDIVFDATGTWNAGATVYTSGDVVSEPFLKAGTILMSKTTGEYAKVISDATGDHKAILQRGINQSGTGAVTAYIATAGDTWVIVTLGKEEGADPTTAAYEPPEVLTNYIQTFNRSVFLTNAFKGNKLRSDQAGPLKARRIQALENIAKDIELAYFLGTKLRLLGSTGYQYYTGGIKQSVDVAAPSNALDGPSGTGVALTTFNAWLQNFMTVGSDAKLAFCGSTSYAVLSSFANTAAAGFRIMQGETVFGMNITTINTPYGELSLAMHPLFKEIATFNDWMFVIDLGMIQQKTMESLFLEPNIQSPGQDSYKEQFRAKLGLKLKFAQAFGYAKNFQKLTVS